MYKYNYVSHGDNERVSKFTTQSDANIVALNSFIKITSSGYFRHYMQWLTERKKLVIDVQTEIADESTNELS